MEGKKILQHERMVCTYDALLQYANACNGTCIYFEPPVDNDETAMCAIQIAHELWEDESLVSRFLATGIPERLRGVDPALLGQWIDALHGPFVCMETHGDKALLLCEGSVFEVVSFKRSWDAMIPCVPDVIMATLLPTDDVISYDGLLLHHHSKPVGPGVERVRREFEQGCKKGVVRDSAEFARESRRIRHLWRTKGLDPTCYSVFEDAVLQINELVSHLCFPYELKLPLREWDEPVNFSAGENQR